MSQVHVKFLGNLQKDFYLLVSETDEALLPPSSSLPHHLNLIREKDIYMRAALQLLDQKNNVLSPTNGSNKSSTQSVASSGNFGQQSVDSGPTPKANHDENLMHDVIRLGYLKKGTRAGPMNISHGAGGVSWKGKYVEVRHGLLTYDDYHGGAIYVGNSDLEDLTRSDNYHRRSIKLTVGSCQCQMLAAKDGNPESAVFEIALANGPKRLWKASNVDECREWVKAIRAAMVGGTYSGGQNRSADSEFSDGNRFSAKSDTVEYMTTLAGSGSGHDISRLPVERIMSEDLEDFKTTAMWSSIDGAAAPYAADMSTFLQLQEAFLGCIDEPSFRAILHSLYKDKTKLTIPVLFIKSKTTHSHFMLSAQDTLSSQNIRSKCSNQVWKDLARDVLVVNGEQISGELGAESMLGALVRHLADKADMLRLLQEKQRKAEAQLNGNVTGDANKKQDKGSGGTPHHQKPTPITSDFAISEAQIIECAKDLLVLCNRTQSGGDTYFCVEAFLSGDHMKDFCILTPYSAQAEPLEFKIDVVEVSQHLSAPLRRKASQHPQTDFTSLSRSNYDAPSSSHHVDQNDSIHNVDDLENSLMDISMNSAQSKSSPLPSVRNLTSVLQTAGDDSSSSMVLPIDSSIATTTSGLPPTGSGKDFASQQRKDSRAGEYPQWATSSHNSSSSNKYPNNTVGPNTQRKKSFTFGEDSDEDIYLSRSTARSKRTALRLSGNGSGLGLKPEDVNGAKSVSGPSTPVTQTEQIGGFNGATGASTRRAQLDLKRELEEEGFLNSVWNRDGTSTKISSSISSNLVATNMVTPPSADIKRQQFSQHSNGVSIIQDDDRHHLESNGVLLLPQKSTSPLNTAANSRPMSSASHSDGVAIPPRNSLDLSLDETEVATGQVRGLSPEEVMSRPTSEKTSDIMRHHANNNPTNTNNIGNNSSNNGNNTAPPLPPLPPNALISSPSFTIPKAGEMDNFSVMSELTFDTTYLQKQPSNGLVTSNSSNRSSGHHDAQPSHRSLERAQLPLVHNGTTTGYCKHHKSSHVNSHGGYDSGTSERDTVEQSHGGEVVLSDEDAGHIADHEVLFDHDDDGNDSGSGVGGLYFDPETGSVKNGSKKKSLFKRLGKKLRPFKMPQLTSENFEAAIKSPFRPRRSGTDTSMIVSGPDSVRERPRSSSEAPLSASGGYHNQFFAKPQSSSYNRDPFNIFHHLTPRTHNPHHHQHLGDDSQHNSDREQYTIQTHSTSHNYNNHHHSRRGHHNHHHYHSGSKHHNGNSSSGNHNSHQPTSMDTPHARQHQFHSHQSHMADPSMVAEVVAPHYGLRIQVRAHCRYRVCGANPTGFVDVDSWATVSGTFYQSFLLVGDGKCQLGITDRLVTIEIDGCGIPPSGDIPSAVVSPSGS